MTKDEFEKAFQKEFGDKPMESEIWAYNLAIEDAAKKMMEGTFKHPFVPISAREYTARFLNSLKLPDSHAH